MTAVDQRVLDRQRIAQLEIRLEQYADFYKLWRELQRLKTREASREELEQAAQNLVDAANVLEGLLEAQVRWSLPRAANGG